ncbi:MAG: GNAT family protein, partial [Actinomycetota bacterium]
AGFVITSASSNQLLGQISIRDISLEYGTGQISYWVVPGARHKGVATDALREVSRWAFEDLGLHRLMIHHSTQNEASCGVALRAGFELEGTAREALLHLDGWHDMHTHGRVAQT